MATTRKNKSGAAVLTRADVEEELPPNIPLADPETLEPIDMNIEPSTAFAEKLDAAIAPRPKLALSGLVPGTITPSGAYVPSGMVISIPCDVYPGLDLRVKFNVAVMFVVTRMEYEGPGETVVEKECRRLCTLIAGFENWNFVDPITGEPIPEPDRNDWTTFLPIVSALGWLSELHVWLVGPGLLNAFEKSMGNLQRG